MINKVKKVLDIASTVVVAIIGVLAIAYIVMMVMGCKLYTVLSPSMEPTLKTGSVIIVKPVNTSDLKEGDIITYKFGSTTATHRIHSIEKNGDAVMYRTKGDAKDEPDPTALDPKDVIGKPIFSIPKLGILLSKITDPDNPGAKWTAIGIAVGLVLLVMLPGLIFDKDEKPKKGLEPLTEQAESDPAPDQTVEDTPAEALESAKVPPEEGKPEE